VSSNRLVVFSKSADPGTVKTRLRPRLNSDQCLSLHVALLKDTLKKFKKHAPVLYLSGSGSLPFEPELPVFPQTGADLGERLLKAFERELKYSQTVIVIGTDSPTIPDIQIDKALQVLETHDAVLGPCEDGGYYLIGLRTLIPEIFEGIHWGSSTVLEETIGRMGRHSYQLLETYYDIDTADDLKRLGRELMGIPGLENLKDWVRLNLAG